MGVTRWVFFSEPPIKWPPKIKWGNWGYTLYMIYINIYINLTAVRVYTIYNLTFEAGGESRWRSPLTSWVAICKEP